MDRSSLARQGLAKARDYFRVRPDASFDFDVAWGEAGLGMGACGRRSTCAPLRVAPVFPGGGRIR